jgi:hypothetical protein
MLSYSLLYSVIEFKAHTFPQIQAAINRTSQCRAFTGVLVVFFRQ